MSANRLEQARAWWLAARANPLFVRGAVSAVVIAALDQASKWWIVNIVELPLKRQIEISAIFDLTFVRNRGASFGLFGGQRVLLSLISIGVAAMLLVWLGKLRRPIAAAGASLVIGGALGNLYDRLAYGYVVDFLDFSGLGFPWVFNIADAAINVGVALLILDAIRNPSDAPKDAQR
jgi:signal peptidase II